MKNYLLLLSISIFFKSLFTPNHLIAVSEPKPVNKLIPYLQALTPNSVQIQVEADRNSKIKLYYHAKRNKLTSHGHQELANEIKEITYKRDLYIIRLEQLKSEQKYFYQVELNGQKSNIYDFSTHSQEPENYSFIAMSDAQHGYQVSKEVVKNSLMKHAFQGDHTARPKFALFAGDLVQNGDIHKEWQQQWFQALAPFLATAPVFPAIGNHEKRSSLLL